jgi:transposase, IS5 family
MISGEGWCFMGDSFGNVPANHFRSRKMTDGLFDVHLRIEKIEEKKHALTMLNKVVDWEIFRKDLESLRDKPRKSSAGAKGYDLVLLFKMLVLKTMYNLSYEEIECQVLDRLSFMRFLGLRMGGKVPDGTTLWLFHEDLKDAGVEKKLFHAFDEFLRQKGFVARKGQIVDASIVEAPRQHNGKDEDKMIKEGKPVEGWSDRKRSQKDIDARWTKKRGVSYYGYKNHVGVDVEHKLIRDYEVTAANVYDGSMLERLLDDSNASPEVFADSAYRSADTLAKLGELGFEERLQEQARRNHPLSEEVKERNAVRARIRCRIEHVFGAATCWTRDLVIRVIGQARARCTIGLRNLIYNMDRYRILKLAKAKA